MTKASEAVLITGGATRVGRVLCLALAKAGYDIALHYHRSESAAKDTAHAVETLGQRCHLLQADLQQPDGLEPLIQQAKAALPTLTGLINNASIFERQPFANMSPANYQQHMDINLHTPVLLTQSFLSHVGQGCIINIADTDITQSSSPFFAYLLSKKALVAFTHMAAKECAPDMRVHALCPGIMLPSEGFDETYIQEKAQHMPLKRTATAEELAETALFLLRSPHLTGQCLFLDGGEQLV